MGVEGEPGAEDAAKGPGRKTWSLAHSLRWAAPASVVDLQARVANSGWS